MKFNHRTNIKEAPAAPTIPVKPFNVGTPDLASRISNIGHILDNMQHKSGTSMLLAGSTGIGKTTLVKQLGKLLGLKVVLIEVPHVTEEKLINIPFIVFAPNGAKMQGTDAISTKDATVEMARSHLFTVLNALKPISDAEYFNQVKNFDANTKAIYEQLGGTADEIPEEIERIRRRYHAILFLDEYWRQTTMNVRNILRNILNGRIGNDKMPQGVYVLFASNMSDVEGAIEDIPSNADYKKLKMKPPTKNEFFHYLISAAEQEGIKLKDEVLHAIYDAIDESHISYDDTENEVRTSPRRWEQIIHYINAAVPVKSESDAKALLANIDAMFRNESKKSSLHVLVDNAVRKIISATGTPEHKDVKANDFGNWRDTLDHQIAMKMKLGDTRTYVPVISGPPGIGKTTQMGNVAEKNNLLPIVIDSSTLSSDEITGIPLSKRESVDEAEKPSSNNRKDKKLEKTARIGVTFSPPPLYIKIMQDAEEEKNNFLSDPKVSDERKELWNKQKYKYLLFFDELNRVGNIATFNNLRRLILDKSFNDQFKIPDSYIMVAEINPTGIGTTELTGHMKDAMDIITAAPSWPAFEEFLKTNADKSLELTDRSVEVRNLAKRLIIDFANKFGLPTAGDGIDLSSRQFYIPLSTNETSSNGDKLYISPREYATLYAELVSGISRIVRRSRGTDDSFITQLIAIITEKFHHTLDTIIEDKNKTESPQFMLRVDKWISKHIKKVMETERTAPSLAHMFEKVLANPNNHLADDENFQKYFNNWNPTKFTEEINNFFTALMNKERKRYNILTQNELPKKQFLEGTVKILDDLTSKLLFLADEMSYAVKKHNISGDVLDFMEQEYSKIIEQIAKDFHSPKELEYEAAWTKHLSDTANLEPNQTQQKKVAFVIKWEAILNQEGLQDPLNDIVNSASEKLRELPWH